jgi:hypothetical protein
MGGRTITNKVDAMGFKWDWNGRYSKHIALTGIDHKFSLSSWHHEVRCHNGAVEM